MKYVYKLKNGQTIESDNIKCPICGKIMTEKTSNIELPRIEVTTDYSLLGFNPHSDSIAWHHTTYECPGGCCNIDFEHKVENAIYSE